MPLTLQHICQYLPHGLKVKEHYDTICDIMDVSIILGRVKLRSWDEYTRFEDIQLVLRPLSDITREITHKGQKITISELFEIGDEGGYNLEFDHGNVSLIKRLKTIAEHSLQHDIQYLPYDVVKLLHSFFFDTDGLIESGLAISTHDLKEDPYK